MEDRDPVKFNKVVDWIENEYNCAETAKALRNHVGTIIVSKIPGFFDKTTNLLDSEIPAEHQDTSVSILINKKAEKLINPEALKTGLRNFFGNLPDSNIEIIFQYLSIE